MPVVPPVTLPVSLLLPIEPPALYTLSVRKERAPFPPASLQVGPLGGSIRGHEFHYWESEQCGESFHAKKPVGKRQWDCVNGNETLYAGFPHLFFWSAPESAYTFLKKCEEYGTC